MRLLSKFRLHQERWPRNVLPQYLYIKNLGAMARFFVQTKLQTYGCLIKIHPSERELCSIEWCQPHICVTRTSDPNVPLAQRECFFPETWWKSHVRNNNRPQIQSESARSAVLRKQSGFAFWEVLNPSEIHDFLKTSDSLRLAQITSDQLKSIQSMSEQPQISSRQVRLT